MSDLEMVGGVILARSRAEALEASQAFFDCPRGRRYELGVALANLADLKKQAPTIRRLRLLTGDRWNDWCRGPEQYAVNRRRLLDRLLKARRWVRDARSSVDAIPEDFGGPHV
jgi:hypothetical protein